MSRSIIARAALALLLLAAGASAASLDRARQLYREDRLAEAQQELVRLLDSDSGEADRAAALDLLAAIAVQQQDLAAARTHWAELAQRFADRPEALAAGARLDLIDALLECRGAASGPAVLDPVAAAGREPAPDLDQAPPQTAPPPLPPGPKPLPPAPVATSPPPRPDDLPSGREAPSPAAAAGVLLIGGTGQPYDPSQDAVTMILDSLGQGGVSVLAGDTEIPAIRGEEAVLAFLLAEARERGAAGLLFVTSRFGFREFVKVERYSPEGVSLWKEMVRGGYARKGVLEQDKVNEELVQRLLEKLERRIGTPDLAAGG